MHFYIGPKELRALRAVDPQMVPAIWFGMFSFVSVPLLSALNWIHGFVGNYGWSILVLTVLINAVMFPLRHKSFVSMRKMQEIQPQVKMIQDRYAKLKRTPEGGYRIAHPRIAQQYRLNVGTIVEAPMLRVRLARLKGGALKPKAMLAPGRILGEVEEYFIEQLVPGAPTTRDDPRGERQEHEPGQEIAQAIALHIQTKTITAAPPPIHSASKICFAPLFEIVPSAMRATSAARAGAVTGLVKACTLA